MPIGPIPTRAVFDPDNPDQKIIVNEDYSGPWLPWPDDKPSARKAKSGEEPEGETGDEPEGVAESAPRRRTTRRV